MVRQQMLPHMQLTLELLSAAQWQCPPLRDQKSSRRAREPLVRPTPAQGIQGRYSLFGSCIGGHKAVKLNNMTLRLHLLMYVDKKDEKCTVDVDIHSPY